MATSRTAGRWVALAAAALALAACGGTPQASVDPGERPDLPVGGTAAGTTEGSSGSTAAGTDPGAGTPASAAPEPVLPVVTVWDVGAKQWVQLADFLPADKPLLVWFWAPH